MGHVVRWEPMMGLSRLREEMDRLMEDFFGETTIERAPAEMMRIPKVDVINRDNDVLVRAELPGIDKDKLQIEATPEALMIRAEIKLEKEEKTENFVRRERRMGSFQRVLPMPAEIKPDAVKASYRDGVLEVILPKSETAKAQYPVKVNVE